MILNIKLQWLCYSLIFAFYPEPHHRDETLARVVKEPEGRLDLLVSEVQHEQVLHLLTLARTSWQKSLLL